MAVTPVWTLVGTRAADAEAPVLRTEGPGGNPGSIHDSGSSTRQGLSSEEWLAVKARKERIATSRSERARKPVEFCQANTEQEPSVSSGPARGFRWLTRDVPGSCTGATGCPEPAL